MKVLAKTFSGLEEVLEKELIDLGFYGIEKTKRGVWFESDKKGLYLSNLSIRTALRILKPIFEYTAYDERRFYKKAFEFEWEKIFDLDQTFAIDATINSEKFSHSQFFTLRLKDAICDRFNSLYGRRPNIDTDDPNILINLFINQNKINISLDSSGNTLNKRNYRVGYHQATINESLAAGIILLSNIDFKYPVLDPFCGSGTLLIEAMMIQKNIYPGILRDQYSFMNWADFDIDLYNDIKENLKSKINDTPLKLYCSDINQKYLDFARISFEKLDYSEVDFKKVDFFKSKNNIEKGTIVCNPPYGNRLNPEEIDLFYKNIGDKLKNEFQNWDTWIFSGNLNAIKKVGLKTSKRINLFNSQIECKLLKYEMYQGTKRTFETTD